MFYNEPLEQYKCWNPCSYLYLDTLVASCQDINQTKEKRKLHKLLMH